MPPRRTRPVDVSPSRVACAPSCPAHPSHPPLPLVAHPARRLPGSDDFQLRIYNFNTHEKIAAFEAHPDYIRCLTVHPTLPLVLTGSDDMTIKCWDWEKGWKCVQVRTAAVVLLSRGAWSPHDSPPG